MAHNQSHCPLLNVEYPQNRQMKNYPEYAGNAVRLPNLFDTSPFLSTLSRLVGGSAKLSSRICLIHALEPRCCESYAKRHLLATACADKDKVRISSGRSTMAFFQSPHVDPRPRLVGLIIYTI
jgi:hypothetical protein